MLRINRQTDYAFRVILALSKKAAGKRFLTSEIGREMLIPRALLQRIVAKLAGGGFIHTQAGRDGGITLAHDPKDITLLQVVEQFEGELYLSDCILKPGECPFEMRCPVHCQWVRLKNILRDEMARITFQQLVEEGSLIETFQQLVEEGSLIESNLTTSASHAPNPVSVTNNILLPFDIPA